MTDILRADSAGVAATSSNASAPATSAADAALQCECEVIRIGELFVELGYSQQAPTKEPTQWELTVTDDAMDIVLRSTYPCSKPTKVVKLKAGRLYSFQTRLKSDTRPWGPASVGRFRMHPEVLVKCPAIGEDNAVLKWERPVRSEEPGNTLEKCPELSAGVRAVEGFHLKILNQKGEIEFHESFETGVRTYTVYGLRPGSRYIVHASWNTLLGQQCKWQEVVRFETQSIYEMQLTGVGEDFISVSWVRELGPSADNPDSAFQKSTSQPLQFEVVIEGGGHNMLSDALELQSSNTSHTINGLLPATQYQVKVRAMSTRGRWGVFSKPLGITTLTMLYARLRRSGENFAHLEWGRQNRGDDEGDELYRIHVLGVTSKFSYEEEFSMAQVRADGYQLWIDGMSPGNTYKAFCQAFRHGHADRDNRENRVLWSEGVEFSSQPRPTVSCRERGEDFVTVAWQKEAIQAGPDAAPPEKQRYELQVLTQEDPDAPPGDNVAYSVEQVGESVGFRIPSLLPDTQYSIQVRSVQEYADDVPGRPSTLHGLWSDPVVITTLRPIVLQLVDIGEDFLQLSWQRALKSSIELTDKPGIHPKTGGSWYDLKYEVVLGCIDSGEDNVLRKELVDTSYRISQLTPNTTYSVAVRACDEKEQWGLWCTVYFRTLSSVVLKCHEVGENFARVVWEREAIGPASTRLDDVFGADSFVSKYRLLLYCTDDAEDYAAQDGQQQQQIENGDPGNNTGTTCNSTGSEWLDEADGYTPAKGSPFVIDKLLDPTHTSCRIPDLVADRQYAVVVRAASKTGIWGLWSEPVRFCTVTPFEIPVHDLSIGENYVHFVWARDDHPVLDKTVTKGDYNVTSQQLRIRGLDDQYSLDRTLASGSRDLKVYGLKPASAYSIQIRSCNTSGEWGTWSRDVRFQTRATIVMRTLEIAEDYIIVKWERKQNDDRNRGYPSGRGYITRYHLRVTGENNFSFDAELLESNSSYRIPKLDPDTRYRIVIKANYNDDEWGLWSRPLECLTLKLIEVKTLLIGEEFANIKWNRPEQPRELVFGNSDEEQPISCFGQHRPQYQLRVTTRDTAGSLAHGQLSWQGLGLTTSYDDASPDPELREDAETKIVMETEVTDTSREVPFTVPNMKPDTYYTVVVRSRIEGGGTWGVWSRLQRLITLKPCVITFTVIGEDFARIAWERPMQNVVDTKIAKGKGVITQSQVKVKTPTGQVQTYDITSASTNLSIDDFRPATTYQVSVRTFNDNHDWGLWSPDGAFRTISGLVIDVESIGEDYIWMSFARQTACTPEDPSVHTVISVDTSAMKYQVRCVGENGFSYVREMPGDAHRCLSMQGLEPNVTHEIAVRGLSKHEAWGQWNGVHFQTLNRLAISFGNIGEQFAVINWERPRPEAGTTGVQSVKLADPTVTAYRLRVCEVGNIATTRLYDLPPQCKSFEVPDLSPNSTYSVWIASRNPNGQWGLWSAERRVHTHPPLTLAIDDIGESYACVSWDRDALVALPSSSQDTDTGADPAPVHLGKSIVQEYHVKVEGMHGAVVERHLEPDVQGCKVEGLEVDSLYQVMVRMKDAAGEWGLWSTMQRLVTLRPVALTVHKVGESFVHLEWGRRKERRNVNDMLVIQERTDDEDDDEENEEDEEEEDEEVLDESKLGEVKPDQSVDIDDDLDDVAVGSEEVRRWIVRVCRVSSHAASKPPSDSPGGNPPAADPLDQSEFELPSEELTKRIAFLEPDTTYTVSVRALSASGEWGFWSVEQTVSTLPLIQTNVSYIGEDFIMVTWDRVKSQDPSAHLGIFPPENAVHNYQLRITHITDPVDPEKDREFDVSQPKYEVWELSSGAGYQVGVRELDTEGNWGMWSELRTCMTLDPIGVKLVDLGECYSSIRWERVPRITAGDSTPMHDKVSFSEAESTLYQVVVESRDLKGVPSAPRSDQYSANRQFKKGETEWVIPDLQPNKSYTVKVRCQTDGAHWGGWSESLSFATMKMLCMSVECLNEDNALLSWNRDLADWLMDGDPDTPSRSSHHSEATTVADLRDDISHGDDMMEFADFADIKTGSHEVTEYDLRIEGLGHDATVELKLPTHLLSYRVTGLLPDRLYSVAIRSRNTLGVWSMWSPKISMLTLNTIGVEITKIAESFMWLSWGRSRQDPDNYASILEEISDDIEREQIRVEKERAQERKRRELEVQAMEREGGADPGDELLEPEQAEAEPQGAQFVPESYLQIENLHTAPKDCTACQLKIWGDGGYPLCPPVKYRLPPDDSFSQVAADRRKKRDAKQLPARVKREAKSLRMKDTAGGAKSKKPARGKAKTRKDPKEEEQAHDAAGADEVLTHEETEVVVVEDAVVDDDADRCLLDCQLRRGVFTIKIECLLPETQYACSVRARNGEGEWGIWSPKVMTHTLVPLKLCNSRFGEHYINLYWYRPSIDELAVEMQQEKLRKEFEENKKVTDERDRLEKEEAERNGQAYVKAEDPESKERGKRELKAHKQRMRELRDKLEVRKEGRGVVHTPPGTAVEKFVLRVTAEDGSIEDRVFSATDSKGEPSPNLYTVANLIPNHLYVASLIICYGEEWGEWSSPIKFMTQNLLQLSISYVGESFIQLDWKRAPNKRLKGEDMTHIRTTPTEQGLGHHYQIDVLSELENKTTGILEEKKQSVDVVDTNSFRITGLVSDMKYALAVREWDPKGDWGLWSPQRCCMTLSRMIATVADIGENWIEVSWERMQPRIKYDDPSIVSIPVSVTAYYLSIEELDDNDLPEDAERRRRAAEAARQAEEAARLKENERQSDDDASNSDTDSVLDEEDQMAAHRRRQRKKEVEDRQHLAELEAAVAMTEKGVIAADGRYRLTRKLGPSNSSLVVMNLKSNRFCNVRVRAETSGNELGVWSPDCFFITKDRINVTVELVGEDSFTVSWQRPPNRLHPRLSHVHEGDTSVQEYDAEVEGRGGVQEFHQRQTFTTDDNVWRVAELCMDSIYCFKIRSKDSKGRWSLYSEPMEIVTLRQMRVYPVKTTEQLMIVQWGRDVQKEEDYPERSPDVQLIISQERTMQYHIKVWSGDDRKAMLVDKTFIGSLNRYVINYLTPNTRYFVEARACNAAGEWGAWSRQGEVCTMKLLCLAINAVGESYVKLRWWRQAPDAVVEAGEGGLPLTDGSDEMEDPKTPTVYTSADTDIDKYQLNITLIGTEQEWDWSTDVPNTDGCASRFTISGLLPNKRYQVSVKASYKDGDWGTPSPSIATATLNVISVEALEAGEDYLKSTWHRLGHTYVQQLGDPALHVGTLEKTLRWQYRITDLTEERPDDIHAAASEDTSNVVVEAFTGDTNMLFQQLIPNRRYKVEVRHWYLPIEVARARAKGLSQREALQLQEGGGEGGSNPRIEELGDDGQPPAPEGEGGGEGSGVPPPADGDAPAEEGVETSAGGVEGSEQSEVQGTPNNFGSAAEELLPESEVEGEPGIWGDAAFVATLKPMVAIVEEIAEDFFSLRWERDPASKQFPSSSVAELSPDIQGYHVMIDQFTDDGTDKNMGEGTLHIDHEFGPEETAFRVTNLFPATTYRVMVRACTDGQWGLWSKACVLITLPKLSITVNSIGEDYVVLSWDRIQRQLSHMQALIGSSANVSRYQLEMYGVDQTFHTDKKFRASRTSYKVKRLEANSMYTVRIRSCDASNVWSLWSDMACFVTLKSISVSFGKVAEQFVHIKWSREEQSQSEYQHDPPPILPDSTVTKHHLCVFAAEHAPSAPLVDKHFSGDVNEFKVSNLNPNSMYIVIVRAANSEMQWGSWSEERTALTLPLLNVKIDSVGENYISLGWGRDDVAQTELQSGVVVTSTEWHVVVTSHDLQYEKQVGIEELMRTNGLFTVPSLKADTKYILTLRACYGNDEWGLWTNPITFLTLNQLGLTVSNISEDRADFTWGRGVQSVQHAYDPNLVIWKGLITNYTLQIKKLGTLVSGLDADISGVPPESDKNNEFFIERDMEINRFKYIQTYCTTDDLEVNMEYLVRVRAMDDRQRWGEWTELVFETPPLPPGKPNLKKAHSNYIAFEWDPPDTFNRYLYCVEQATTRGDRKKDGGAPEGTVEWKVVDTVTETFAKIKTATAITKCRFRVKCCKMDKPVHLWSKYSQIAYFTAAAPPDAVSNLSITSLSKSSATLEWTRPTNQQTTGPDGNPIHPKVTFKVLLGEKDGPVHLIGTTKSSKYELTGLKPNTHYRTQVQVETENGLSAKNTILKFSTRADLADPKGGPPPARHGSGGPRMLSRTSSGREVHETQMSSESSDTLGNKVRLPVLSPPRTAPLQATVVPPPVITNTPRPPSSPAPASVARSPHVPLPPTGESVRPAPRPPPKSAAPDARDELPSVSDATSPTQVIDRQSQHSDEDYDVLSLQHSDSGDDE